MLPIVPTTQMRNEEVARELEGSPILQYTLGEVWGAGGGQAILLV